MKVTSISLMIQITVFFFISIYFLDISMSAAHTAISPRWCSVKQACCIVSKSALEGYKNYSYRKKTCVIQLDESSTLKIKKKLWMAKCL